jgi:hypothetical protein
VPVGDVLVCDAGSHVKHDDTALAVDVVPITETAKLLLASRVPDVELDLSEVLPIDQYAVRSVHNRGKRTVVKPRGWTSTPSVAMYFFSNSPVRWRFTKVVYSGIVSGLRLVRTARLAIDKCERCRSCTESQRIGRLTLPVPPSPTSTSLKVGTLFAASAIVAVCCGGVIAAVVSALSLEIIRPRLQSGVRVAECGLQTMRAYLYCVGG